MKKEAHIFTEVFPNKYIKIYYENTVLNFSHLILLSKNQQIKPGDGGTHNTQSDLSTLDKAS